MFATANSSAFARSPLRVLASLRLTVICLGLGMLLVFLGTLSQVHLGIHAVQAKYFQSLFVFWSPAGAAWKIPILPGGYLLGTVLLVNLIAAHATRFQLSKKKTGIILLHLGVILLLIGQLLTGLFARETQMRIDEGETLGYSDAPREVELAVIDATNPDYDQVVAIPEKMVARGGTIQNPTLPFTLQIKRFLPNARVAMRSQMPDAPPSQATTGTGTNIAVTEIPRTVKDDERDLSAADVENNRSQRLVRHVARLERDLGSAIVHGQRPHLRVGHAATAFLQTVRHYAAPFRARPLCRHRHPEKFLQPRAVGRFRAERKSRSAHLDERPAALPRLHFLPGRLRQQ